MGRAAGVMSLKPCVDIFRNPDIALIRKCEALQEINVFHGAVLLRRGFGGQPSQAHWVGLPTEALAKVGGGQGS